MRDRVTKRPTQFYMNQNGLCSITLSILYHDDVWFRDGKWFLPQQTVLSPPSRRVGVCKHTSVNGVLVCVIKMYFLGGVEIPSVVIFVLFVF